jgi:excisionase family DNA binding protein
MINEMMTYREAAIYLTVPIGSLYSMVARGEVPHVRLGKRTVRFRRAALEAWVAARTVGTEGGAP